MASGTSAQRGGDPAPPPANATTRRRYVLRLGLAGLGLALIPALKIGAERSGLLSGSAATAANALLLAPADFAGADLREVQRLGQRETRDGGQTAQVLLASGDARVEIFQSVAVFPSEGAARAALQAIRQAREAGQVVPGAPSFGDESVVLRSTQGTRDSISAVFRQDRALLRITVTGTAEVSAVERYAQKAEEKARQREQR
ncbi:MAG: hypothetical protein HYU88_07025 [Chloroflexi bacterium]|nr:hypothetical protein [Chloroflexota bacterium]